MRLALEEAKKGEGLVSPNPCVGAVLVRDGKVIAKGFHGEMGKLHAERVILEKIGDRSQESGVRENTNSASLSCLLTPNSCLLNNPITRLPNCTLYVTLEPCCHHGKTPPCTDAIIESGIKKVVIAQTDPNPLVSGKGLHQLLDAGIEVVKGVLEKEAQQQIRFFRHWISKNESYCVGKLAVSVDGFYASADHFNPGVDSTPGLKSQYFLISSPETKQKTRAMRKAFDAILIGKKTLLADNPNLGSDDKDPLRIILCQKADFQVQGLQAFRDDNVLIACKEKAHQCDFQGKFLFYKNLKDLKQQLFHLGIQSVLIEGGGEVINLFLQENLLQELLIVQSKTCVLNTGQKMPEIPKSFHLASIEDLGTDILQNYCKN